MAANWTKIRADYIKGGISLRDLAAKHGVSFNTLKTHAVKERWADHRGEIDNETTTRAIERATTKVATRQTAYKEPVYEAAAMLADKILQAISMIDPETMAGGSVRMRDLTGALKDIADIKHLRSEADIREQEARIKRLQHEVEEQKDSTIEVVIANGMEDLCK